VPKNVTIAVYYFELAALLGNPSAMNELGFCFQNGHGVTKDAVKAAEWYKLAAIKGVTYK
jgi:TPR repeat protein